MSANIFNVFISIDEKNAIMVHKFYKIIIIVDRRFNLNGVM